MIVSYSWLQSFFDEKLPSAHELGDTLTFGAFEVESIKENGNDTVLDIDVLPNRAHDCLSHRGIAKEISSLLDIPITNDPLGSSTPKWISGWNDSNILDVTVEDSKLCRRFCSAVIEGVEVGDSPEWLVKYLESIGQKTINNIVDATNFVMFNIGQPLHAFDRDTLQQIDGAYNITVRLGRDGESIKALDGEEYEVGKNNLLITDGNGGGAIGIAGVKGGASSEITKNTKNIIIESANFDPVHVRKTARQLKLRTDASARFENEPSVLLPPFGVTEVVALIQKIAGGMVEGYVDVFPHKQNPYKAGVSLGEVNNVLGTEISDIQIKSILDRLYFDYEYVEPQKDICALAQTFEGVSYTFGASVTKDAPNTFDCSSFVAYVFAQNGVWLPRMSVDQYVYGAEIKEKDLRAGDVVFSVGNNKKTTHYESKDFIQGIEVPEGVSHCGIYLGDGKVIHASGKESRGVVVNEELKESSDFNTVVGYRRFFDDGKRYVVTVPFERGDIRMPIDLIEEIGRVYGYIHIESKQLDDLGKNPAVHKTFFYAEKVRRFLSGRGFSEVYTYSLVDRGEIALLNSLASDKDHLRASLESGLTASMKLNIKNRELLGVEEVRIFEVGKVFGKYGEHTSLGIAVENLENYKELLLELSSHLGVELPSDVEGNIFEINFDEIVKKLPPPVEYEIDKLKKDTVVYKSFSLYPLLISKFL